MKTTLPNKMTKAIDLRTIVRDIPDFPKKGILFKDITPVLQNPEAFRYAVDKLAGALKDKKIDYVVGIESRGFIMSPVLANIYLHQVLDQWFINNRLFQTGRIVRYADDAVFFFKSNEEAQQFMHNLVLRVRSFDLELNMDKTRVFKFDKSEENSLQFLGLSLYYGKEDNRSRRLINIKTAQQTLHRKIQEFYHWIKAVRSKFRLGYIWQQAKTKLSGHYNYYGYDTNVSKLRQFYFEALRSLFKWLNRRSQLRSFSWKKFQRKLSFDPLPVPPVKAFLRQLRRNVFHIQANRWLKSPVREIRMRGSVGVLPPSFRFANFKEER